MIAGRGVPVVEALLGFVNDDLLLGESKEVAAHDEIVLDGTLDSLGVARLVGFIEGELGIPVPAEEVTIDHFRTIATIAEYLAARSGPAA